MMNYILAQSGCHFFHKHLIYPCFFWGHLGHWTSSLREYVHQHFLFALKSLMCLSVRPHPRLGPDLEGGVLLSPGSSFLQMAAPAAAVFWDELKTSFPLG